MGITKLVYTHARSARSTFCYSSLSLLDDFIRFHVNWAIQKHVSVVSLDQVIEYMDWVLRDPGWRREYNAFVVNHAHSDRRRYWSLPCFVMEYYNYIHIDISKALEIADRLLKV